MPSLLSLAWLRALVWLLALALPLQAQARASMLECGAAAVHQQHEQPPMAMAGDGHEHHHAHGEGKSQEHQAAKAHQCSACAACFIGAALPSAALSLGGPIGHSVHLGTPEPASLAVVTAGLERPPRPLLA